MSDETIEPYPSERRATELGKMVAEAVVDSFPIVGGVLAVGLQYALGYRLADRQEAWLNSLAQAVNEVAQGANWEELAEEPEFVDAVVQATRAAATTSQEEKLQALRNGVAHVVVGDAPAVDERARFFRLVDEFEPVHMQVLYFCADPRRAFSDAGKPWPDYMSSSRKNVLKELRPDLEAQPDWLDLVIGDLERARLIVTDLSGSTSGQGLGQGVTSPLGDRFLAFVAAPVRPSSTES